MPRANGNDLAELFGYAPDDNSDAARKQWKSQKCPFTENTCIKHSHPQNDGSVVVYGTCSVLNKARRTGTPEEVIGAFSRHARGETDYVMATQGVWNPLVVPR